MKINGWFRLWIVFSCFYLVAIFLLSPIYNPVENYVYKPVFYNLISQDTKNKIAEINVLGSQKSQYSNQDFLLVEMPNKQLIAFKSSYSNKELEKASREYWGIVENYYNHRLNPDFINALKIWLLTCIGILCLGLATTWVIKGFKK
ncbi:TPA: hypothetical protein ACPSKY_000202 [Legionella bozemanae]